MFLRLWKPRQCYGVFSNTRQKGSVALISFRHGSAILAGFLGSQWKKLSCSWQLFPAISDHLALLDHVHQFDARQSAAGWIEGFEAEYGANDLFDRPVILFDEINQVFDLTNLDGLTRFLLERLKSRSVGVALVNGCRPGCDSQHHNSLIFF